MPSIIAPDDLPRLLRPGMRVYVGGTAGESEVFAEALAATPQAAAGVRFLGVWLPGLNRIDYAGLHPQAQATAFFITRQMHRSFVSGRIDFLPIAYSAAFACLRDDAEIDLALLQVSPPGRDGRFSLGIANDFGPAILAKARHIVAHINPRMPATRGAATLAPSDVTAIIEQPAGLITDRGTQDGCWAAIGAHVAGLIRDGDTLEVGIGNVQSVFSALAGAKRLRIHSGAISTPLLQLAASRALDTREGAVVTGIAYGSSEFLEFVGSDPRVRFASVGETHDPARLRAIPRLIAINSVIEVDLLGQANAEMVDGRQVGGVGGLVDFMRGARSSEGGLAIVALPATTADGERSRIVDSLARGTAVSVGRADMDVVVTEFGTADLRRRAADARAEALIAIAAPQHRDSLAAAWRDRRGCM
ncbi:MAG: 4-hydroxybutyrate coenzyme A transferase [Rhodospirillales bacterium]|nr:4-hydroxybutyrate coenzyme A transferase [Rhodospirillales bacterium]